MNKNRKITLGLIGTALITVVGIFGATAGTLAWYAYSSNVLFSFSGTSVQKSVLLNIGLVDPEDKFTQQKCVEYDVVKEEHDGKSIIFTHSSNGLSVGVITEYLTLYNHATNYLFPVTSRERLLTNNGDLSLYKSPDFGDTTIDRPTDGSEYARLPFAFKIAEEGSAAVQDKVVWLTDAVVTASGENVNQAVRVFVETSQRKFLMKPADDTLVRGETKVGGLLDLDGDMTYDYDELQEKELYYGDFTAAGGEVPYKPTPYDEEFVDADLDDVNGTNLNPLVASTFCAKHKKDIYPVDLDNLTPKVAQYETFGTVKPLSIGPGNYYSGETGIPLCDTTETTSGIGYCTMTIFIEGWDHAIVDKAVGHHFNLGLRFEISRLQ